jgi:hypothetical protein
VFEPGKQALTLADAVALVERHADSDAWFLRVTGNIIKIDNVLIPSTLQAITPQTYRRRSQQSGGH